MTTENYFGLNQNDWKVGEHMSADDYKRILDKMSLFLANIPSTTPQESKEFLIKAGIFDHTIYLLRGNCFCRLLS
jgi:hypothetical protein